MAMQPELIESTAGQVAEELARRGIPSGQRVTITIEPDEPPDWLIKARHFARPKVIAEGWTDTDIDRIVKEEREAVQPPPDKRHHLGPEGGPGGKATL